MASKLPRGSPRTWTAVAATLLATGAARADEGGVSFWLPGQLGSLIAVPGAPGFSVPGIYYHTSVDASAQRSFQVGGNLVAGIDGDADLVFLAPTYTFGKPVAGGRASVTLGWAYGEMSASVDAVITGPLGNSITRSLSDSVTGGSDLYPQFSVKWNDGAKNWMTYAMADIPVGAYDLGRLANIGINHYAVDGGGGFTYFDPMKGHEVSIVAGLTYNFENRDTDYRNGVDMHVDFAASKFLSQSTHVGLAGYIYYQLSGDSGGGAKLGDNKARVYALGPQFGHFFPFGKDKGYVNVRANWEFDAKNRPEGWNVYATLSLPVGG